MMDTVGIAVVGTGDRGANLARDFAGLPDSRLVALHHDGPGCPRKSAARRPVARAVASLGRLASSQASLEQGGIPVRLAPARQETT